MEGPASSITTEIATTSWQATPLGSLFLMMRCTLAVREGSRAAVTTTLFDGGCTPDSCRLVAPNVGRGRDEDYSPPSAQIPACAANAPGSSLGSNIGRQAVKPRALRRTAANRIDVATRLSVRTKATDEADAGAKAAEQLY